MKRPSTDGCHGSCVTTPRAAALMRLLGAGVVQGGVALTRDEYRAIHRLYGHTPEKPQVKPPPPEAPRREDYAGLWEFRDAERVYENARRAHGAWSDPAKFLQAGADRNALRHAECDGLRLLAWVAKHVPPGDDPLKHLVQLAIDAGWDVDPADVEWAQAEESEAA